MNSRNGFTVFDHYTTVDLLSSTKEITYYRMINLPKGGPVQEINVSSSLHNCTYSYYGVRDAYRSFSFYSFFGGYRGNGIKKVLSNAYA